MFVVKKITFGSGRNRRANNEPCCGENIIKNTSQVSLGPVGVLFETFSVDLGERKEPGHRGASAWVPVSPL